MDLFNLQAGRVQELATAGFDLRAKTQVLIFESLIETGDVTTVELTWSQLRSCYQYLQENHAGRFERVRYFFILNSELNLH